MATSLDYALWDAVAAVQASYMESATAANEADEYQRHEYEPTPWELAAVDAALAAGADPDRPLSYEEFRHWNQGKVISVVPLLYPMPEEYKKENQAWRVMNHAEYRESRKANHETWNSNFRDPLSAEEYKTWYEVNVKPMRFYVLMEALDVPQVLERLLAAGASPDVHDPTTVGDYALHALTRDYYNYDKPVESIKLLLATGADVNVRNRDGRTPLQEGCWNKSLGGLLSLLLKNGASVSAVDYDGDTALHGAAFHDEGYKQWPLDEHEELRAAPYDDYYGARSEDVRIWGAREAVNALIDAGADPNAVNPQNGYTPMHWASVHHGYPHISFLEALFERGGEVCIPDHRGRLPLDMYCEENDEGVAKLLRCFIESLRDSTLTDAPSMRLARQFHLWRAVIGNHMDEVEAALADGAMADQPISTDEIVACVRARSGMTEPPEPADETAVKKGGQVLANYAIFRSLDKPEILHRLLAAGAKPDTADYIHGYSPLHMLASGQFARPAASAAALLAAGADVDQLDREGRTPLQTACKHKADGALIRLFLQHGAVLDHRDAKGMTALEYATQEYSLTDLEHRRCRWIADEYSPDDSSPRVKRIFAFDEEPWTQKDAERALRRSDKT